MNNKIRNILPLLIFAFIHIFLLSRVAYGNSTSTLSSDNIFASYLSLSFAELENDQDSSLEYLEKLAALSKNKPKDQKIIQEAFLRNPVFGYYRMVSTDKYQEISSKYLDIISFDKALRSGDYKLARKIYPTLQNISKKSYFYSDVKLFEILNAWSKNTKVSNILKITPRKEELTNPSFILILIAQNWLNYQLSLENNLKPQNYLAGRQDLTKFLKESEYPSDFFEINSLLLESYQSIKKGFVTKRHRAIADRIYSESKLASINPLVLKMLSWAFLDNPPKGFLLDDQALISYNKVRQEIEDLKVPKLFLAKEAFLATALSFTNRLERYSGIAYSNKVRLVDPNDSFSNLFIASLYLSLNSFIDEREKQNNLKAGMKHIKRVKPKGLLNYIYLDIKFNFLRDQDRSDEALEILSKYRKLYPKLKQPYIDEGNYYHSYTKEYKKAIEPYSKLIQLTKKDDPNLSTYLFLRGIVYERSGIWDKAEEDFLASLEIDYEQPRVLNYLGYSWVDMNINTKKGLKMIREALDKKPNSGYIIDSLGWAYYRLKQYDKAVIELERAITLDAGDPTINDHLGDAYNKVGRKREAKFQWLRARTFDPDKEVLDEKLEKKIESMDGL